MNSICLWFAVFFVVKKVEKYIKNRKKLNDIYRNDIIKQI